MPGAMSAPTPESADEIADLLDLIRTGQLFSVQKWIADRRPLCAPTTINGESARPPAASCPLRQAVQSGFHSLVEVLVAAGGWPQWLLDEAFERASAAHRTDIAHLLRTNGATFRALDFADVCRSMNQNFMEEALRGGCSPSRGNAFAHALVRTGAARPLLSFYKRVRSEFPVLDGQAALALSALAREGKARAVALLAWAGADPLRAVPFEIGEDDWSFEQGNTDERHHTITAAESAMWSGKADVLKALKLKPNAEQARPILALVQYNPSPDLLRALLEVLPGRDTNVSERGSSPALEGLVARRRPWVGYGSRTTPQQEDEQAAECMDELLQAGARWNPPFEALRDIRRALLVHEGFHVARVLRLLLYTPGSCDRAQVLELCRTSTIRQRIHSGDPELLKELTEFARRAREADAESGSAPPAV